MVALLLEIFVRVILPVFVIVAIGYAAGRLMQFDQRTLSRLGLYVLVPCLNFSAMARTTLSFGELGQIVIYYVVAMFALYLVSILVARGLRLNPNQASAFHISILFANVVNVGLPVLLMAYGQSAVERGIVVGIMMQILLQSFGVYLAARGKTDVRAAMKNIWTMPGLYAMLAGLAVNLLHIQLPTVLFDPIKMIGDSLVPYLLILMGLQLTRASFRGNLTIAFAASLIRLIAAAVIGTGLASVMGLQGVTRQALIVENSMPSAIFGVALAQEFDAAPELITVIITISTLMSLFTLTVLIAVT